MSLLVCLDVQLPMVELALWQEGFEECALLLHMFSFGTTGLGLEALAALSAHSQATPQCQMANTLHIHDRGAEASDPSHSLSSHQGRMPDMKTPLDGILFRCA